MTNSGIPEIEDCSRDPSAPRPLNPLTPHLYKIPGLYIHIPFCLRKCHYCNFYSSTSTSLIPQFLEALFKEMERVRSRETWEPFDTVYLGGGTPSLLTSKQLESILDRIRINFVLLPDAEITLEANPGDLDLSFLQGVRSTGINRLNIGIQSFDPKVLDLLGRRHSREQALSALDNSRKAGFQNMGLDLIYAVPGQDLRLWRETLDKVLAFAPEHLSCYQLTIEPSTPLGKRYQRGEFKAPPEELQYDFFMKTSEWLEEAGYLHYEVSNFARGPSLASRHNQKYWDHTPYLGLGPAAHSFRGRRRWWNRPSLDRYLNDIREEKTAVEGMEVLTDEQFRLEALFLGLRTKRGISLKDFVREHRVDLIAEKRETLSRLEEEGFLSIEKDCLFPTRAGLAVADRLALI